MYEFEQWASGGFKSAILTGPEDSLPTKDKQTHLKFYLKHEQAHQTIPKTGLCCYIFQAMCLIPGHSESVYREANLKLTHLYFQT